MYSSDMGDMFDISEARTALQAKRQELLAECDANAKLQRRFDQINSQIRGGAGSTSQVRPSSQLCLVLSCPVLYCPVLSSCSIFPCILYSLFLSSRQYFSDFVFLLHIRNSSPLVFFLSSIFFLPLLNFLTITTILPFFPPLLSHNSISFITCLPSFLFSLHFFPPFISFLPAYLLSLHFISPFISFHFSLTSDGF